MCSCVLWAMLPESNKMMMMIRTISSSIERGSSCEMRRPSSNGVSEVPRIRKSFF